MIKNIHKSAALMIMLLGLIFVMATPNAMAQGNCRKRSVGGYQTVYNGDRYYDDRYTDNRYYQSQRNRNDRNYDDYYDREDTTGKAVKRTAIGAGIGALGGAVIGGKKGAAIGAAAGAAGGYIYHRNKVNKERDRYYRY